MPPTITLIITQREAFACSRESLESVLACTPAPFKLIYVDGGSPEPLRDQLGKLAALHGFTLLREERFLSPNEAKCLALPYVDGDYAIFLENDVLVYPGWLEALITCAEETRAGAVAPIYLERVGGEEKLHMVGGLARIVERHGHRQLVVTHDERKGRLSEMGLKRFRTEHVEVHALLVRADLLWTLALFDPAIPTIPENIDLCLTLLAAGEEIWMEPLSRVMVVLPECVEASDRLFYVQRWGDEWIENGLRRFCQKWQLEDEDPVLVSQRRWSVAHRMVAYPDSLHRRLGVKSDSILNRRLLAPLEHRWLNR